MSFLVAWQYTVHFRIISGHTDRDLTRLTLAMIVP